MRTLALTCLLLLVPTVAAAQTNSGENPMGFALVLGSMGSLVLSCPVLLHDHVPRPGAQAWQIGMGYQSGPHSLVMTSSAGGYFRGAPWIGIEGRSNTRLEGERAVDLQYDVGWYALLRPTRDESPVWAELLLGASAEMAFGLDRDSYATAGPSGGLRLGFRLDVAPGAMVVFEGEGLYNARFGDDFSGVRHQLEAAGHFALVHRLEEGGSVGFSLEYRRELALTPEPTLADTHLVAIGAVLGI